MDKDIDNTILSCKLCQDSLPSQQKEPFTLKPTPQRPFQEITADFCSHAGQQYLITVDCFSDWPEITPMMTNTMHDRKAGVSPQIVILSHWCPRQSMDRPRPTVHIRDLPKVCETMGLRTRYLITKVSSKQWKGRSYSKVHVKDHPISMAWTVPRREQVGPSTTAIPKHPITQRLTRSSPKIVWTTNTRHPASP